MRFKPKYGDVEETREWLASFPEDKEFKIDIEGVEKLFKKDLEEAGITNKPVVREAQPRFQDLIKDL